MWDIQRKVLMVLFFLTLMFSTKSFSLVDGMGLGTTEDKKDLQLLYIFNEKNDSNLILNQIRKNDLSHPSHLKLYGNSANVSLAAGQILFKNNMVAESSKAFSATVIDRDSTIDYANYPKLLSAAEEIKSRLPQRVYLRSQGLVSRHGLCGDKSEGTLQIKFRPTLHRADLKSIFYLGSLASDISGLRIDQMYGSDRMRFLLPDKKNYGFKYLDTRDLKYSDDGGVTGVSNEMTLTYGPENNIKSFFGLHHEAGRETWFSGSQTLAAHDPKVIENSFVQIGAFPNVFPGSVEQAVDDMVTKVIAQRKKELADPKERKLAYNMWRAFQNAMLSGYIGSIERVAFYCREVSKQEVLGGEYTDTTKIKVTPDLVSDTSPSENIAVRILSLLTKKKIPIDAGIVKQAAALISKGQYKQAAQIGVELPDFYNNTVKDMGLKMSNREETADAPLNDFSATVIGSVRDNLDARELLTGNYFYRGSPLLGVPSDIKKHMLDSNIHYTAMENAGYDLKKALLKVQGQKITATGNRVVDHPDPAGVISSRAFLSAHADAGTNRRPVEYAFKQFMCVEMNQWADTQVSDLRVGRDIDRFPAGSHNKYQTNCKGCHTVMDGFRGAFAKIDFKGADILHGGLSSITTYQGIKEIAKKMNHNDFVFSKGYVTTDDSFYNFANSNANKLLFGWRGNVGKGYGMGQFGRQIASSQRFSRCMVKRVFETVCPIKINEQTLAKLEGYVQKFESEGYKLKNLFVDAVTSPLCLGGDE